MNLTAFYIFLEQFHPRIFADWLCSWVHKIVRDRVTIFSYLFFILVTKAKCYNVTYWSRILCRKKRLQWVCLRKICFARARVCLSPFCVSVLFIHLLLLLLFYSESSKFSLTWIKKDMRVWNTFQRHIFLRARTCKEEMSEHLVVESLKSCCHGKSGCFFLWLKVLFLNKGIAQKKFAQFLFNLMYSVLFGN